MVDCPKCGEAKEIDEFPIDRGRPSGRHPYCKPCKASFMKEAQRRWKKKNPEAFRATQKRTNLRKFARRHGLDVETIVPLYESLLESQDGRCAICGEAPGHYSLAVDHDHATGAVRGLLCSPCNLGVGHFRDNPKRLRIAAAYIERNTCLTG